MTREMELRLWRISEYRGRAQEALRLHGLRDQLGTLIYRAGKLPADATAEQVAAALAVGGVWRTVDRVPITTLEMAQAFLVELERRTTAEIRSALVGGLNLDAAWSEDVAKLTPLVLDHVGALLRELGEAQRQGQLAADLLHAERKQHAAQQAQAQAEREAGEAVWTGVVAELRADLEGSRSQVAQLSDELREAREGARAADHARVIAEAQRDAANQAANAALLALQIAAASLGQGRAGDDAQQALLGARPLLGGG